MTWNSDIIVIGAGIAGASAAAELAADADVILLEAEAHPGYHATGRSAAYFAASYGKRVIREISACCEIFFMQPPAGFAEVNLLRPRECFYFGRPDQQQKLAALQQENPRLLTLSVEEVATRVPIFRADYLQGALRDCKGGDLDVDAILQAYIRLLRRRGGQMFINHEVNTCRRIGGGWRVTAAGQEFAAPVLVNAAGAWADRVAVMANIGPLGLKPLRRTAFLIPPPGIDDVADWPQMIDADEEFYFKPEAGQIMISPADESPSEPCDAQPEDIDVATGLDRFERATGLDVRRVSHRWAGLRTFAPDRLFVTGFDPRSDGFFWLAGQGGYGIQSAPALAMMSAALITGSRPVGSFEKVMDYVDDVAPERLL